MINTLGGRGGGHGLYLLKGKPVFVYNFFNVERFRWESPAALAPGKHTVVFDFKYDGPGFGKGGSGVLSVDGKEVASRTIPHTIPFVETIYETFDVGVDTRTGVDDKDYGKRLRAFVVLEDGAEVSEDDLKAFVKQNLARYKVPREIVFLDELPRNATGKVLKRELVDDGDDGGDEGGEDDA